MATYLTAIIQTKREGGKTFMNGFVSVQMLSKPPANAIEIRMQPDDILHDVNVHPFTRTVWHGPEHKQKWEPIFRRAATLNHRVEYEMVKRGHRLAATLHLTPSNFDSEIERIQKDGLVWLPLVRTKRYQGFSHRHFPTSPDDPNSSVYGVLAQDMAAAKRFKEASESTPVDHETIGELLGFPKCCIQFFNDVWARGFYDPIWQAAERSKGVRYSSDRYAHVEGSILCSQIQRYTGHRVTSHLPCSFTCEATMEIGQVWWDVGVEIDPEAAADLLRILALKQHWSVLHGIAVIETPYFTTWTNSMPTRARWDVEFIPDDWREFARDLMNKAT